MLATCSNILQLWNTQDYSLSTEFGQDHLPATDTIKCIDWKRDNSNYLVFTYRQTGRVHLYDIQKNKSVELSASKAQWCSFSSSGKYLSVSNEDGQAHIWDVNSGRVAQTFTSVDQSAMECICWGNGDSYVAAGTRKGNVFLYNQLTKQTFAAFTMKHGNKLGSISSIKWSPHKELLATTSNDGLLSLWNYRVKECIISIHSHKAPATDLAFSPHHDAFLVVSGMDGSLCCLDVTQQKVLSTISIYAPLTSVDFHPNGSLVAVGTMGQGASVYDLRDPKTKLAHLVNQEHGNVYAVRFEMGPQPAAPTLSRPTTLTQETTKPLSTFAQQTSRSRHTSSSSIPSTTPVDVPPPPRSYATQPRPVQSRERSLSSVNSSTISKSSSSIHNSTTTDGIARQARMENRETNNTDCMSFEDFAQLCGVALPSSGQNEQHQNNNGNHSIESDELLKNVNSLRDDVKEDLDRTKLAMQMHLIVELQRLRTDLMTQIESHSLNGQLVDEVERLRAENKRLRQLQPRI